MLNLDKIISRRASKRMYKVMHGNEVVANLIFVYDPPKKLQDYAIIPDHNGKRVYQFNLVNIEEE